MDQETDDLTADLIEANGGERVDAVFEMANLVEQAVDGVKVVQDNRPDEQTVGFQTGEGA